MAALAVRVTPRASAERVGPFRDGALAVRVTRPPADGEANRAVQRLLADALRVAPGRVRLVAGARSRDKRFEVDGMTDQELAERLRALPDAD
ncbi:MAG TPA: DUF167 domain-containing protein [candidate division Zixibacteria bacterium]|nr:DUF167 domain-containing protein [candidate division Zixibacteria bacterium]